jgi:hypothetical protein
MGVGSGITGGPGGTRFVDVSVAVVVSDGTVMDSGSCITTVLVSDTGLEVSLEGGVGCTAVGVSTTVEVSATDAVTVSATTV